MEWLLYALLGLVAGLLAGLLGIGGGLVMVPVLVLVLPGAGVPDEQLMHVALGTALAAIIPTSIASARSHHRRGAVQWSLVVVLGPAVALGALLGAQLAGLLSSRALQLGVAVFCQLAAVQMASGIAARRRNLPPPAALFGWGLAIGAISALVGIGGGSLTVPLLVFHGLAPVLAVATSAACGLPIALAGSLGYVVAGWTQPGLPQGSLGFVYVPAVLAIGLASVIAAPLGARLAHWLPAASLRKLFALVLALIGSWLGWSALRS